MTAASLCGPCFGRSSLAESTLRLKLRRMAVGVLRYATLLFTFTHVRPRSFNAHIPVPEPPRVRCYLEKQPAGGKAKARAGCAFK